MRYRMQAKGRHSIHSPFVYELYENCIYSNNFKFDNQAIEAMRSSYLNRSQSIEVMDFGAGSRVSRSNQRKISDIARYTLKSAKEAHFVASFAQYIQAKIIIELGTSLGITTAYIATANPKATIFSIEGSETIHLIAKESIDHLKLNNIELLRGNFEQVFPSLLAQEKPDLIYIDGNHTEAASLRYFELAIQKMEKNGFILLDDIYWSKGMTKAWETIIADKRVSLSIDLYHFGIISLKEDFTKQHFILKF
jgi:predicted O-methyltransferase YrrM